MKNIKKFLFENKIAIIAVCVCIAVFTAAFFTGGILPDNKTPSINDTTVAYGADDAVHSSQQNTSLQSTTPEDKNQSKSSSSEPAETVGQTSGGSGGGDNSSENAENSSSSASSKKISDSSSSSSGTNNQTATQDKYKTDPVPSGKPSPVEPEQATTGDDAMYCTFTITCATILDNMDQLDEDKTELVPSDGIILKRQKVKFTDGESVYDVLVRVCKNNNIHFEASMTPMYNSYYIEAINNLYEFDCGSLSGWMYKVNDWFPNYGCSRYQLKSGDDVVWCYTCNLGYDVGSGQNAG